MICGGELQLKTSFIQSREGDCGSETGSQYMACVNARPVSTVLDIPMNQALFLRVI